MIIKQILCVDLSVLKYKKGLPSSVEPEVNCVSHKYTPNAWSELHKMVA